MKCPSCTITLSETSCHRQDTYTSTCSSVHCSFQPRAAEGVRAVAPEVTTTPAVGARRRPTFASRDRQMASGTG